MDASTALEAAWAQNLGHMVNSWCCWALPLRNTANSLVFDGFVHSSFVHVSWKACGRQVSKCHFIVQRGNWSCGFSAFASFCDQGQMQLGASLLAGHSILKLLWWSILKLWDLEMIQCCTSWIHCYSFTSLWKTKSFPKSHSQFDVCARVRNRSQHFQQNLKMVVRWQFPGSEQFDWLLIENEHSEERILLPWTPGKQVRSLKLEAFVKVRLSRWFDWPWHILAMSRMWKSCGFPLVLVCIVAVPAPLQQQQLDVALRVQLRAAVQPTSWRPWWHDCMVFSSHWHHMILQ